ncbi:gliding motility-associated lipoprotein GldJ/gliding motility-associated lipoprotein GldJ,TIGR03530 [bacterium A37T11]|nr:gliding motility-associated lipoprotein GldJ/gliding motility-associated lipoprotein GldJ,TIGR03530 [bacterium A37T11]
MSYKHIKNFNGHLVLMGSSLVCLMLLLMSQRSPKTGADYDDQMKGWVKAKKKNPSTSEFGMVEIEGGSFVMGGSQTEDLAYTNDNLRRRVTVATFYMDETEVTNIDWLEYLNWIGKKYPDDRELYYNAIPDTLVWRNPLSYNEPYVDNYLRHPAYQDYPVVGVTWEQANDYCQWRTDRINENILSNEGTTFTDQSFNTDIYLNGQYGNSSTGKGKKEAIRGLSLMPPVRLPTEAEWEYAALALGGNAEYGLITDNKVYPWNGLGVRSEKRRSHGLMMANFKISEGDNMGISGYPNDGGSITTPVASYPPNDFGLYDMAGNVNEWVGDVYRQLSFEDFDDFNPFRGNVFTNKRLENTQQGIYAKDKYGRPIRDPAKAPRKQTWEELQKGTVATDSSSIAGKNYDPDFRGYLDSVNKQLYGVTTLVNNESRVYKGGSWNDRAYWLNPGTRRFMQQDQSSAIVGFRCAMTLVGGKAQKASDMRSFKTRKGKAK